jgi:hypothetical protein
MANSHVAVIAIHGVGDHQPFEMARAAGDMLENLDDGPGRPRYSQFEEDWVRVNVAPVTVANGQHETPRPGWGPLDELRASGGEVRRAAEAKADSLDHLFMQGQIAGYKGRGPEDTYEILRLKGRRMAKTSPRVEWLAPSNENLPQKEVHIYDMYWSDLSGLGTAGLRIFGELYQLLFHLGSVGVNNVIAAAIALRNTPARAAWDRFATAQKLAVEILAKPIPLLNLIMLAFTAALVLVACLAKLSVVEELITTSIVMFALVLFVVGFVLTKTGLAASAAFRWTVVLFLLASAGVSVLGLVNHQSLNASKVWSEAVEVVAGLLFAGLALWAVQRFIISAYERRRPGVAQFFKWSLVGVILGGVLLAIPFLPKTGDFLAVSVLMRFIEVTFWAIYLCWLVFWIALVVAFVLGWWAVRRTAAANDEEADRAARTNWTARLTLAVPAVLFHLITYAGWMGLLSVSLPLLPHLDPPAKTDCAASSIRTPDPNKLASVVCYAPILFVQPMDAGEGAKAKYTFCSLHCAPQTAQLWAYRLSFLRAGFAPVMLLLICFAAVVSIWSLTPSVLNEAAPPRDRKNSNLEKHAKALEEWLDNGYGFLRWAGRLIYLAAILALPVMIPLLYRLSAVYWYREWAVPLQEALGLIVAGAGVGILGLGGRLSKLSLGFRPIVRVALDVDNWMREHPRGANPTARICARYVSLLRYIAQWKGEDGNGYDALVIFAHSQGTVVTSDLLRFLEVEAFLKGSYAHYDPSLAGMDQIDRYLLTVGCPLRQLYALRFPYLYGYASTRRNDGVLPNPQDLGVCKWVNAYRTGDYVGRYLWQYHPWKSVPANLPGQWDPAQAIPADAWHSDGRVEFPIGPGAHTHYRDSTAEPIAETLDVLIAGS